TELTRFQRLTLPDYRATSLGEAWLSPSLLTCVHACLDTFTVCYTVTYNTNNGLCAPGSRITYSPDNNRTPDEVLYFTNFCDRDRGFQVYLFNGFVQCLFISSTRMSFNSSRQTCTDKGARLYMPKLQQQLALLRHIVSSITRGSTWIGLTDMDIEGVFVWEDGKGVNDSLSDLPWRAGNPDNAANREDCVEMGSFQDFFYINDQYCGENAYFICEAEM
ncbi:unnamed protein product, partial [Candidula unifasciata]